MKTQIKIITYLIAILMLLQPLMVTVAYATETGETEIEVVENTELVSITISDEELYGALKLKIGDKAISYTDEDNTIEIYQNELDNIKELVIENSKISDLSGIENFKELTNLDLSGNSLTENSSLEKLNLLTKLVYLDLSNNQIKDVTSEGSNISSLLNKEGLQLNLDQQFFEVVSFVDIIRQPEEYEDAEDILLNDKKEFIDLQKDCPILLAYDNMNINILEIRKADGSVVDESKYSDYLEIKDGKIRLLNTDSKQYEIILKLEGDSPNNGTTCRIKAFRIDKENQVGIEFKDKNLYKAIKEKYEYALQEKTSNFMHENYDEWYSYKFLTGEGNEWTFDDKNLIIIANKKDINKIESITVASVSVKDLTGIEEFVGVSSLNLYNNRIIDISKINELDKNKKEVIKEYKEKYDDYVAKLDILVSEYNDLENQINTIDKEIEDIEKAEANNQPITGTETTGEKEARKQTLIAKQEQKIGKIIYYISKIEEISNDKKISLLLLSPSLIKELEEVMLDCMDLANSDVLTQKDTIEDNQLIDFANRITMLLDNLTRNEIIKLVDVELGGKAIITEELIEREEAKYAIQYMQSYIDKIQDEDIKYIIDDINELTGSEISEKDKEGKEKSASTIRSELKSALNRYYNSKNNIASSDVITKCLEITDINDENDLLVEVKDTIIPVIKENIIKYASDISESLIGALRQNITNNVLHLDIMKERNEEIINDILIPAYEDLLGVLESLVYALENDSDGDNIADYLTNNDDLLRVVKRLQAVSNEDIAEFIKVEDLVKVELDRNLISEADALSNIETLEVLDLSNNLISEFDFSKFQNIEQLYLGHNSMKSPKITEMKNIRILDLSYNWIDDVSEMNLSGMPKLVGLYLNSNKIEDIEHLIKSKNDYIETLGYKNLGEYWQVGHADITVASQIIDLNLKINTDKTEVTVDLPAIFSQLKNLETDNLRVIYDREIPCTNVYSDGTKAVLDTTEKNVNKQANVYMSAGSLGYFTCRISYIVIDDETAPTITGITGIVTTHTNSDITLTIEGAADAESGLNLKAYSFDNGTTWQASNSKTYTENTENIIIQVKDLEGNVYTHEPISITTIDKVVPVMNINKEIVDTESGKSSVTVTITENESGLSEENKYEYCLSTSKEEANGTWTAYVPGEAFTVGEGLSGTYYMFTNSVSDKAGNASKTPEVIEFTFAIPDTTNPTITGVTGNPENWTKEDVTLTIEGAADETALDNEPYSFDGGASWQESKTKTYTENTKDINILVRDAAGNKYKHEVIEIAKIDKKAPTVNVNKESTNDGKAKVTISIVDSESGLNSENEYKYYVSTSKDELIGGEWTEYKLGETFEIGTNLANGKYYLTIKDVKDNANNEIVTNSIEIALETKAQQENQGEEGTLEYLTLSGITKLIRAYITDDYSDLPESFLTVAGEDNKFDLDEITKIIRLYLSI